MAKSTTTIHQKLPIFHHFPEFRHVREEGEIRLGFIPKHMKRASLTMRLRSALVPDVGSDSHLGKKLQRLVGEFDPAIPIEEAFTPPSSWYNDKDFHQLEINQIFNRGWHPVGYTNQIQQPYDFFSGRLGAIEYVVCRDETGALRAFHNVCRHHASLVAFGEGKKKCFVCPYHGWTYGLDGALVKATRIDGIKNFEFNDMGLVPLNVGIWGPFVLINPEGGVIPKECVDSKSVGNEWLGSAAEILDKSCGGTPLDYICRKIYTLECNWKVFCDNYLDGGYHVPHAHKSLASDLQLDSYTTTIYEKVSIQSCGSSSHNSREEELDRLGSKALYAFIYPNFMINRYGPWMDTNLVLPMGSRKCKVIFDYFLDTSIGDNRDFISKSLEESERVQEEDITLCRAVQQGLGSPAYKVGRYSPKVEMPMYHFHGLLHENLRNTDLHRSQCLT